MSHPIKRLSLTQAKEIYGNIIKSPPKGPESSDYLMDAEFGTLVTELMAVLHEAGYPKPFKRENAPVDQKLAAILRQYLPFTPAEASDVSIWRAMNCEVFPWLVCWRWSQGGVPNPQRFFDRARNYLGNLWWRAELFSSPSSSGSRSVMNGLLEDDFIGILERPGIRGYLHQVQQLAGKISEYRLDHSGAKANEVIRKVIMNFRVFASAHDMFALDDQLTSNMIARLFADAESEVSV